MSNDEPAPGRTKASTSRGAFATLLCLLCFAVFWAGAMALYPGGTWLDRAQTGQSFFGNFFCDLTQPISLSGVANPVGSRLAQCGMIFFAAAMLGFFWLVPRHFSSGKESGVFKLGLLAVCLLVAVPLMPSEYFGRLHAALALASGCFGILASLGALAQLFACGSSGRALFALGTLTLAAALFAAVVFVLHLSEAAPPPLLVPAAQKVAALLASWWIIGVASRVLSDNHSRSA
jgi:hypothetical protein